MANKYDIVGIGVSNKLGFFILFFFFFFFFFFCFEFSSHIFVVEICALAVVFDREDGVAFRSDKLLEHSE